MDFQGFTQTDFDVFGVPGLEPRMEALQASVRPKLNQLGAEFAPWLSDLLQTPMYAHVAKHARRTVNAPNDSWVAFAADKRGYKKHPHFQIGLWYTHLFATFGLIYESPAKVPFAAALKRHAEEVVQLVPEDYVWYPDHTNPEGTAAAVVGPHELVHLAERLTKTKQGELLVGIRIERDDAVALSPAALVDRIQTCFSTLAPLYDMAVKTEVLVG